MRIYGRHEVAYRSESAIKVLDGISDQCMEWRDWLADLTFLETAGDAGDHEVLFPRVAWDSIRAIREHLNQFGLQVARDADESGAGPSGDILSRLTLSTDQLYARVAHIQKAQTKLDEATNWIDSFQQANANGQAFEDFRVATLEALSEIVAAARTSGAYCRSIMNSIPDEQVPTPSPITQSIVKTSPAVRSEDPSSKMLTQGPIRADSRRSDSFVPKDLQRAVEGTWTAELVNPWGQRDRIEIRLRPKRLMSAPRFEAVSVLGWRADAEWRALGMSSIQVAGLQSAVPGGPLAMPFSDCFDLSFVSQKCLDVSSLQGLKMRWTRP